MRPLLALVLLLQVSCIGVAHASEKYLQLLVTDPYVEMHSGPGRGFPVVYVVGRDDEITVLYSRTDWYKIRAANGRGGMGAALGSGPDGAGIRGTGADPPLSGLCDTPLGNGRRLRVYNRQNLVTAYGDFGITNSIDLEFVVQQALGTLDNRYVASIGLRHTFVPEWKWFSPTAGIGTAYQYIEDKVPPAPLEKSNQMAYVSLGARGFITRRFMWRADWRHYVVFNSLNVSEELEEWKVGLAVFF